VMEEADIDQEPEGLAAVAKVLGAYGYEPRFEDDALVLGNCPYDRLASDHRTVVCGLNHRFVAGVGERLGCPGAVPVDPDTDGCCVRVDRDAP